MKKMIKSALLIMLTAMNVMALFGCSEKREKQEILDIAIFSIGKADCIALNTNESSILIDTGEEDDYNEIASKIKILGFETIDCLVITHFDKDHIGSAAQIIENFTVKKVLVPEYEKKSQLYISFMEACEENGLEITFITEEYSFNYDKAEFVLYPAERLYEEENDMSLIVSLTYGENRFLFSGDIMAERIEDELSLKRFSGGYDFLKVPHHGAFNYESAAFFSYVSPLYAVITDSNKNPADADTTLALSKLSCRVFCTANGDVFLSSDGKNIKILQNS